MEIDISFKEKLIIIANFVFFFSFILTLVFRNIAFILFAIIFGIILFYIYLYYEKSVNKIEEKLDFESRAIINNSICIKPNKNNPFMNPNFVDTNNPNNDFKACHIDNPRVKEEIDKYFKNEGVKHIITLSHPAYSERAIRTIKGEIYKRVKIPSDKKWTDLLYPILLKYNYKSIHPGTGFTPVEAEKQHNHFHVKFNMEKHRANTRKHTDNEVGDYVRVHKNKDKLEV